MNLSTSRTLFLIVFPQRRQKNTKLFFSYLVEQIQRELQYFATNLAKKKKKEDIEMKPVIVAEVVSGRKRAPVRGATPKFIARPPCSVHACSKR